MRNQAPCTRAGCASWGGRKRGRCWPAKATHGRGTRIGARDADVLFIVRTRTPCRGAPSRCTHAPTPSRRSLEYLTDAESHGASGLEPPAPSRMCPKIQPSLLVHSARQARLCRKPRPAQTFVIVLDCQKWLRASLLPTTKFVYLPSSWKLRIRHELGGWFRSVGRRARSGDHTPPRRVRGRHRMSRGTALPLRR